MSCLRRAFDDSLTLMFQRVLYSVIFWALSLTTMAVGAPVYAMNLNDASVLLPLPNATDFAQLISPGESGRAGTLIPLSLYQHFGRFSQTYDAATLYSQGFKVVAVRIDPCFSEGVGPRACRKQIRLVFQPVLKAGSSGFTTLDTAVHAFYEFGDAGEWQSILASWPRMAPNNLALQVHPQIKTESLNGRYWRSLRGVILAHCGSSRLARVTAMISNTTTISGTPAIVWMFQGFDIAPSSGVTTRMTIPRINRLTQAMINTDPTHAEYRGEIQPAPPQQPAWAEFFKDSAAAGRQASIKDVIGQAIEIENPRHQNPGTVDCVSCHVSQDVRHWGEIRFANAWNWVQAYPQHFDSPRQNLRNQTQGYGTNRTRSFGYFGQDPVISQRLINETAAVVQTL